MKREIRLERQGYSVLGIRPPPVSIKYGLREDLLDLVGGEMKGARANETRKKKDMETHIILSRLIIDTLAPFHMLIK